MTGGTAITVTGTGFDSSDSVVIGQGHETGLGAIPATNVVVVSSTEITAVTGGGAKEGTWGLFVTGTGGTTLDGFFTYTPIPTVSNVSPHSGPVSGGTPITLTGTSFVSGATVVIGQGHFAGAGAIPATSVVVVSSTEITAVTGGGAKAGTWRVFVINPDGGTSAGNGIGDQFMYS